MSAPAARRCGTAPTGRRCVEPSPRSRMLDWRETAVALAEHAHIRNLPRTLSRPSRLAGDAEARPGLDRSRAGDRPGQRQAACRRFLEGADPRHDAAPLRARGAGSIHSGPRSAPARGELLLAVQGIGAATSISCAASITLPSMLVPFMLLTALSWTAGNVICELARRFGPRAHATGSATRISARHRRLNSAASLKPSTSHWTDVIAKIERPGAPGCRS